ncbi:C40 family peptidase [Brevirhabdus sp.]|uniref:C40 family peptidase n=1 Tax=Brevirhabdus sp. TaxID=2004514 RepID=UPI0040598C9E
MTDRRFHFANARVAHVSLRRGAGVDAGTGAGASGPAHAQARPMQVIAPLADLCRAPDEGRDRQIPFGAEVEVLETRGEHAFLRLIDDGYVGYMRAAALGGAGPPATHRVMARSSQIYTAPELKAPDRMPLPFGARLRVRGHTGSFAELAGGGYVPLQHIAPLNRTGDDPAAVAQMFLGSPYLWGGDSAAGVDCSGLVLAACDACGIACPRDSDLQAARLGQALPEDAPARRGDLIFWKGHVAMMLDDTHLIHANAHHMAVAIEPAAEAIARIARKEFGAVTVRRRLG